MEQGLFEQIMQEIEKMKEDNTLVLVEGSNDKKALNELGIINAKVIKGKPLYKIVEEIEAKEVIILTDLDKEGKKLYHELKDALQRHGIKINDRLRILLFKTELRQIEGLKHYLEKNGN